MQIQGLKIYLSTQMSLYTKSFIQYFSNVLFQKTGLQKKTLEICWKDTLLDIRSPCAKRFTVCIIFFPNNIIPYYHHSAALHYRFELGLEIKNRLGQIIFKDRYCKVKTCDSYSDCDPALVVLSANFQVVKLKIDFCLF